MSESEIRWIIQNFTQQQIAPEQMAAWAMAVYFRDMSVDETTWLTEAMIDSGTPLQWPDKSLTRVDKHSTGGIGDKISLVLAPLLAELGLQVPMISGRGLGPTGGTLDKLESIPGFRTELPIDEFQQVVSDVGCSIVGASKNLAPADQALYALRDVTGTVPSIPLITASILSKKLSEGLDALVMDVKWGSGAFMKTPEEAARLANRIVKVAQRLGVPTTACLTNMERPLGKMIGNACEVAEARDVLQGRGPEDVQQLTLELAARALQLTESNLTHREALERSESSLKQGNPWERFQRMVVAQGGNLSEWDDQFQRFPVCSERSGYVQRFDAEKLGYAVIEMGGGRKQRGDQLDLRTGLEMNVQIGDLVTEGQPWVSTLNIDPAGRYPLLELLNQAIHLGDQPPTISPLIGDTIGSDQGGAQNQAT